MLGTQVVENAVRAVRHLRSLGCEDIEFSPEDAGRSDPKFLYRVLEAVIEAGATTLNIPDTTGVQQITVWLPIPQAAITLHWGVCVQKPSNFQYGNVSNMPD